MNEDDIQEPVEERGQELTTEETTDLHRELQQEATEEISSAKEEGKKAEESLTSSEIREMCEMWEEVRNCVEKHHPDKAAAVSEESL